MYRIRELYERLFVAFYEISLNGWGGDASVASWMTYWGFSGMVALNCGLLAMSADRLGFGRPSAIAGLTTVAVIFIFNYVLFLFRNRYIALFEGYCEQQSSSERRKWRRWTAVYLVASASSTIGFALYMANTASL
jgi:hypothetical protein